MGPCIQVPGTLLDQLSCLGIGLEGTAYFNSNWPLIKKFCHAYLDMEVVPTDTVSLRADSDAPEGMRSAAAEALLAPEDVVLQALADAHRCMPVVHSRDSAAVRSRNWIQGRSRSR